MSELLQGTRPFGCRPGDEVPLPLARRIGGGSLLVVRSIAGDVAVVREVEYGELWAEVGPEFETGASALDPLTPTAREVLGRVVLQEKDDRETMTVKAARYVGVERERKSQP